MSTSPEYAGKETIPTYEESIRETASAESYRGEKSSSYVSPPSLTQQLASVRSHRINAIISTYIDPLLQSQALAGLFKTTLVLIPSNTTSLQQTSSSSNDSDEITEGSASNASKEEVVGFRSEDYIKLVRLHGEEYTLEFWRQPTVIKELDSSLKAKLQASGHRMAEDTAARRPQPAPANPLPEPVLPKRGFFRRKPSETLNPVPAKPNPLPEGTWRYVPDENISPGHVRTKVKLEDVCLRVVTEMGLYDTKTGKAVVVNIEIGS